MSRKRDTLHRLSSTVTGLAQTLEEKQISPTLKCHRKGRDSLEIPYTEDLTEKVGTLLEDGWLHNARGEPIRIVMIAHGLVPVEYSFSSGMWMERMNQALVEERDQLVILLKWDKGANPLYAIRYDQAVEHTQVVGGYVARFATAITTILPGVYIWGIGHSLGAHLMGAAGRESRCFSRITGLDPAGPLFETTNQDKRLCPTDAEMVDVIHTDGRKSDQEDLIICLAKKVLKAGHFGTLHPLGTIDFYPNGGFGQPGSMITPGGNHQRAIDIFIWTIANPGKLCNVTDTQGQQKVVEMGYHALPSPTGSYYIETSAQEPWHDENSGNWLTSLMGTAYNYFNHVT